MNLGDFTNEAMGNYPVYKKESIPSVKEKFVLVKWLRNLYNRRRT